jgi:hypothetical protein
MTTTATLSAERYEESSDRWTYVITLPTHTHRGYYRYQSEAAALTAGRKTMAAKGWA